MSNVLIGIIGVILFIGLALAGALFLGQRFQEASNNSKASSATQVVTQVAAAAVMRNTDRGIVTQAEEDYLVALRNEGFLKGIPINPVTTFGSMGPDLVVAVNDTVTTGEARYVQMKLGLYGDAVCHAIARQSGGYATAPDINAPGSTDRPTGCVAIGGTPTEYIAYARI